MTFCYNKKLLKLFLCQEENLTKSNKKKISFCYTKNCYNKAKSRFHKCNQQIILK